MSTDGGATWVQRKLPDWPVQSVAFSDATHGWAVGPPNNFDATTDGGATWQAVSSLPTLNPTDTFEAVAAARTGALVSVLGQRSVLSTTDGGTTWTQEATSGIASYPSAPLSIVAGPVGFAATAGGNGALTDPGPGRRSGREQSSLSGETVAALALAGHAGLGRRHARPVRDHGHRRLGQRRRGGYLRRRCRRRRAAPSSRRPCSARRNPQLLVGGSSGLLERYAAVELRLVDRHLGFGQGSADRQIASVRHRAGLGRLRALDQRARRAHAVGRCRGRSLTGRIDLQRDGERRREPRRPRRLSGRPADSSSKTQPAGGTWQTLVPAWPWSTRPGGAGRRRRRTAVDHPVPPALRVRRPHGRDERPGHRRRAPRGHRGAPLCDAAQGGRLPSQRPGLPRPGRPHGPDLDQPRRHLAQAHAGRHCLTRARFRRSPRGASARRRARPTSCRCAWRPTPTYLAGRQRPGDGDGQVAARSAAGLPRATCRGAAYSHSMVLGGLLETS